MSHVAGISLTSFEEPLSTALNGYVELSDGAVTFDTDAAIRLGSTPDKPNSARSVTPVMYKGRAAGALAVIAFKPGDGTGDETTFNLCEVNTDIYPHDPKVLPRSKRGIHSEVYLPLGSWLVDNTNIDPRLFVGNLPLLGLVGPASRRVVEIGELAQQTPLFQRIIRANSAYDHSPWVRPKPAATLTTGYLDHHDQPAPDGDSGKRFGDPHAVYNPHPEVVQVGGFIGLLPERAGQDFAMLESLNTRPAKHTTE